MKNRREYAFDILRVASMIMVITVHVSNVYSRSFGIISNSSFLASLFFNTISRISVPLFFMISGALLLDRKFNFKKYSKRLLKFLFLIIIWDLFYLVWEYFYLGVTYDYLYKLLFEPYRAHLWFLYTILLLYAIQPILRIIFMKMHKPSKVILFILWILISTGSLVSPTLSHHGSFFSYVGFFVLGKYLYDFIKRYSLQKYNILWILIIVLCFVISIALNYSASLKYQKFYHSYFGYRTPFIILASLAAYILVISNYQKNSVHRIITKFSDLSLGIYLIHGIFLDITVKLFIYPAHHSVIWIPIFTIIILCLSVVPVFLLQKIPILKHLIN